MTFFETFSGRRFDLLHPTPESVYLPDIAHSLARQNRFIGHTSHGYSVAEHSLWVWHVVAAYFPEDYASQLYAQIHDAKEAYMGDILGPLKATYYAVLTEERAEGDPLGWIADGIDRVVLQHFGLPEPTELQRAIVKSADLRMRATERRCPALMPHTNDANWPHEVVPYTELLDGTSSLKPRDMLPAGVWDGELPDAVNLPSRQASFQPSGNHPAYRPIAKPLSLDDLAFLYEQNTLRLLALVRGTP